MGIVYDRRCREGLSRVAFGNDGNGESCDENVRETIFACVAGDVRTERRAGRLEYRARTGPGGAIVRYGSEQEAARRAGLHEDSRVRAGLPLPDRRAVC